MKSDNFIILCVFSFSALSDLCYRITGKFYFSSFFPFFVFLIGVLYNQYSVGWYLDFFRSFLFSFFCLLLIFVVSFFSGKRGGFCEVDKP